MPSHGKDYSPFPSNNSNTNHPQPSSSYDPSMNASYYPYYPTDSSQYYSQYYSNYYAMPAQTTSYAQAYIDAAYSEAYPQVAPIPQEGYQINQIHPPHPQQKRFKSNNQSLKKSAKLPVAYCNECSRPFYTNLDYQNHLKCHVNCPDCGLTLTKKQLVSHRNDAHPKLVTLDDPIDIQNYIEERKGKYPKSKGKDKVENALEEKAESLDLEGSKKRKMVVAVGYCKFYPLGKCKKGAGCPYYHEMPPGQEQQARLLQPTKSAGEKSGAKKTKTSKIVPKDKTQLLALLNEECMREEDSILLQVIRFIMDNKQSS